MTCALERPSRSRTKRSNGSQHWGLTPREWRMVQRVRRRLHSILSSGEIKSLILYGSKVRGEAKPDSDIDLFLVYDNVTPEQEKAIKEFSVELPDDLSRVHIIEYRADEVDRKITFSPLMYNVAHQGIALEGEPVPKLEINCRHVAESGIKLAKEQLASAQHSLNGNFYRDVISMSYYAVMYAADAALATVGFVPKSHAGTDSLFGYHFFKKGLVDAKFKGLVKRASKARIKADYDREAQFDREDAEHWLARAKEFVEAMDSAIPRWLENK